MLAANQDELMADRVQLEKEKEEVAQLRRSFEAAMQSEQERARSRAQKVLDDARANLKAAILRARGEQGLYGQAEEEP